MLQVYNTLAREKQRFEPLDPEHVRIYACGPTVYDLAHIGNARSFIVFDVLVRLLRHRFPAVTYVRNITDVDDKINAAFQETGEPIKSITERTMRAFHEDMAAVNVLPPDVEPRATEHISQMIAMIELLIARAYAYEIEGHVLFNVPAMKDYGRLSRHNREELVAGARVEVAPFKQDPADFVLWKPSPPELPGWSSPWGRGRPGWHIECSAMGKEHLGTTFDIHGGGQDLIFPHHENEIAQSRCVHDGAPLAKYWMHNGYLTVEGEKMSKSLGNFVTVRDLLSEFPGEAVRLFMLSTHYRQPLDFKRSGVNEAKRVLDRWYRAVDGVREREDDLPEEVFFALEDDLNTPKAITAMHGLMEQAAQGGSLALFAKRKLKAAGKYLLGLFTSSTEDWLKGLVAARSGSGIGDRASVIPGEDEIETMIREREAARATRDFAEADRIRDELRGRGIVLEDAADGTTWRRA